MRVASKLWWLSLIVVSVKRSCFWFNIQLETANAPLELSIFFKFTADISSLFFILFLNSKVLVLTFL